MLNIALLKKKQCSTYLELKTAKRLVKLKNFKLSYWSTFGDAFGKSSMCTPLNVFVQETI